MLRELFWSYERRADDTQEFYCLLEEANREKEEAVRDLRKLIAFVKDLALEPEACAAVDQER